MGTIIKTFEFSVSRREAEWLRTKVKSTLLIGHKACSCKKSSAAKKQFLLLLLLLDNIHMYRILKNLISTDRTEIALTSQCGKHQCKAEGDLHSHKK